MVRVNDASSHDNSIELENLGLGFNGEDDYYDSLNSGNEDDIFGAGNTMRPSTPAPYDQDVYTPESNFNLENIDFNQAGSGDYENTVVSETETGNFTTIVNGVKLKSLPGPRG